MRLGQTMVRIWQWAAALATAASLAACLQNSGPYLVELSITGLPAAALRPGETAQLKAWATYSDREVRDSTTLAQWSTTDAGVLAVSPAGVVTARAAGQAEVLAILEGRSSRAAIRVSLPAAYFLDGVEYAFDYQLDARGRVDSFRIAQRPGVVYANPPETDEALIACTGSLHASFECSAASTAERGVSRVMRGELGRLTHAASSQPGNPRATADLSYGPSGLTGIANRYTPTASIHTYSTRQTEVRYDTAGRPAGIALHATDFCTVICTELLADSAISLDPQGRMARASHSIDERSLVQPWTSRRFDTEWSYGAAGFVTQAVSGTVPAQITRWVADADGWLIERVEHAGLANERSDSFAIVRSAGGAVAEEQFTQAEPRLFYRRAAQRVRYEEGRLPSEPLFVPRAPDGRSAADLIASVPLPFFAGFQ